MRRTHQPGEARRLRGAFAGLATVGLAAAAFTGPAAAEERIAETAPASPATTEGPADGSTAVTLLTGDTIRLDTVDGRRAVSVDHGEGREQVTMHQTEIDGELLVLPLDVVPYLGDDLLDRELFNVDSLIAQGYDDASSDVLPVIATYGDGFGSADVDTFAAATAGPSLESIDAQAFAVDKADAGRFWESVTAGEVGVEGINSTPAMAGGVEKLWLDGLVEADLHESTGQIGAPTAWDAGIDGSGVTVAVLDTGVDDEHPDLAGKVVAEENFSTSDTTHDGHGHGTHVAATVAGTGAGSDGLRAGVAPGADLISGKVLDDGGSGYVSDIIAGMEWAVDAGADVVNMSLGGGPTDGTDPMAVAVNELSAANDVLFVISAGNDGPGDYTIGTPGSADAALTVGAVDRDDTLADFSSRGPRYWDQSVKPDLTAPGVGIVAARSAGTSLGSPVDDLYTAVSGTSMAAPHVAGAAALVASQHPDLPNARLKDLLISTAEPGDLTPYEQGGGRVDVTRAVTQPVTATGTVYLGDFFDDDTDEVSTDVTWTNTGDTDVELTLDLQLTNQDGDSHGGSVTLGTETVTVPAGGTADVPITVDTASLPVGWYSGWLTATAGDVVVHTTVATIKQPPIHDVEIRGINRAGEDARVTVAAIFGEDPRFDVITHYKPGATRMVKLGEGDYFMHGLVSDGQEDQSVIVDPDLEVTEDFVLTFDAREANKIDIETPQPAEFRGHLGFVTYRDIGSRTITNSTMKFDGTSNIYVTPTEPAKHGYFEFTSRWQMSAPMLRADEPGSRGLELWPNYERSSPDLRTHRPLEVVDVGRGLAEDYTDTDVAGKAVVVHLDEKGQENGAAEVAAEAGAAMMLIDPRLDGIPWWTKFTRRGPRLPLPVAVLTHDEAAQVEERLERPRPLRLAFTSDQEPDYRYDIVQVSPDRVPEKMSHTVTPDNTTTITANYHEMGGEPWSKEQRFAWRPWQTSTIVETQHELFTPQTRTEYISTNDPNTLWRQHVLHLYSWDDLNPIIGGAVHGTHPYEPGDEVTYDWYRGVQRPTVGPDGASRTGDELSIQVADFVQGALETYQYTAATSEVTGRVLENGEVIREGNGVWGTYPASQESATYQVEVSTRRATADWEFSTAADTTWTFDSTRPGDGETTTLPMMRVDYDVPVGLDNQVPAGQRHHDVDLAVTHPGMDAADAPDVASFRTWASFDEGETWQELEASPNGDDTFTARIGHEGETVSLKVEVTDTEGNSMEQTVLRAYGLG